MLPCSLKPVCLELLSLHLHAVLNMNCMEEFTSKSSNFLKDVTIHFLFHVLFHVKFGYIGCFDFSINMWLLIWNITFWVKYSIKNWVTTLRIVSPTLSSNQNMSRFFFQNQVSFSALKSMTQTVLYIMKHYKFHSKCEIFISAVGFNMITRCFLLRLFQ